MTKKTVNLISCAVIVIIAVVGSVVAYHYWRESQKSGLEKAAEKTVNWTEKNANKAAEKTKEIFQ